MIPDPIELLNSRIESLSAEYVEGVCMQCGKKVDYDLYCMSPLGDGPMVCFECTGMSEEDEERMCR